MDMKRSIENSLQQEESYRTKLFNCLSEMRNNWLIRERKGRARRRRVQKLVKLSSVISHGGGARCNGTQRVRGFREEITRINNPEVRGVQ